MSREKHDPFFIRLGDEEALRQATTFPDPARPEPQRRPHPQEYDDRYDPQGYRQRGDQHDRDDRPYRRERDDYDERRYDERRDERRTPRRELEPARRPPANRQRPNYLPQSALAVRKPTAAHNNRLMRWGIEARQWARHNRYKATAIGGVAIVGIAALVPRLDDIGDMVLENDACANTKLCSSFVGTFGTPDIRSEIRLPNVNKTGKRLGSTATYSIIDITLEGGKDAKTPINKRNILVGVDIAYDKDELAPLIQSIFAGNPSIDNLSGPLYTGMAAQIDDKTKQACAADLIEITNVAKRHANEFLGDDNPYLNVDAFRKAENIYDVKANHPNQKDDPNVPNIIIVSGMLPKNPAELAKKKANLAKKIASKEKITPADMITNKDYIGASLKQENGAYTNQVERAPLTCGLKI